MILLSMDVAANARSVLLIVSDTEIPNSQDARLFCLKFRILNPRIPRIPRIP